MRVHKVFLHSFIMLRDPTTDRIYCGVIINQMII